MEKLEELLQGLGYLSEPRGAFGVGQKDCGPRPFVQAQTTPARSAAQLTLNMTPRFLKC